MSNKKVNSKMLKDLIKEVLEEQRLDEKNVNLTRTAKKNISKKSFPSPDWNISDLPASDFKKGGKIDKVSGLDGKKANLSPLDVATDKFKTGDDSFYDRIGSADNAEDFYKGMEAELQKLQDKGGSKGGSKSATQFFNDIVAECLNIKAEDDQSHKKAKALLADLRKLYPSNPSGRTAYGRALKKIHDTIAKIKSNSPGPGPGPGPRRSTSNDISLLPISQAMMLNGDPSADVKKALTLEPFGGLDLETAVADVTGLEGPRTGQASTQAATVGDQITNARFKSNVVNQMKLFEEYGPDLSERLRSLEETANAISQETFPTTGAGALKFSAKANVVLYLSNMAKITDSSSAGFKFERFVCAFFNGIGLGGANGAIDAALRESPTEWIPTSQKFLSGGTVGQAMGGQQGIGMQGVLNEHNRILYFAFQKTNPPTGRQTTTQGSVGNDYQNLDVYILLIERDQNIKRMEISGTTASWADTGTPSPTPDQTSKNIITFSQMQGGGSTGPTIRIPVLPSPDSNATVVANNLKQKLSGGTTGANIFDHLMDVFGRLENMKDNTQNYQTTGGGGASDPTGANKATDYIEAISDDYTALYDSYRAVFAVGGDSAAATGKLKESKKITSKMLKKIIQETLKK